jgi:hypothetical protein
MSVQSHSQAGQDIFILSCLNYKQNGFFIEIGSNHFQNVNNSYILEKTYNWKGLMVEYNKFFLEDYKLYRTNSFHIIDNAEIIDYKKVLVDLNFPKNIDYLQIDLDVDNRSTLNTLENLDKNIMDEYKFATITFEHDIYRGNYFNTREVSRNIFDKRGYTRIFSDVYIIGNNIKQVFEDWYVHPELVDNEYINKIITDKENIQNIEYLKCIEILKKY